ncbi:MAG: hypothetical protein J1E64_05035 [Acetatifactor sp.]|nr:hypothetical protein [Acetatifactor sp.]
MTFSDFSAFSKQVIEKYYIELKDIDENDFNGDALSFRKNRLKYVYYFYESYRKDIRKLYMEHESNPMDRHKIASIMMVAILKAKVVKVNRKIAGLPLQLLLANEYLAFYCALNIVELYKADLIGEKYSIVIPDTYIEGEGSMSYVENTCKALYYSKCFKLNDIFSYANVFFMLERYTDTYEEL